MDEPVSQVCRAFRELEKIPDTRLTCRSSMYQSAPMGNRNQPDYINAVAALETGLDAETLLHRLQAIEKRHGRTRGAVRWASRTLDLDLLLYGEQEIHTPVLDVPHPGLHLRSFVLYPLAEIDAALSVPGRGHLADLLRACDPLGVKRLGPCA
jgi:2-amino-4-hydroxy-6-hydroxymethyldihydropteridine diphosphokinase